MKWRIWQEKIMLILRIKNHSNDTLCKQVYNDGRQRSWPGLPQEVASICQEVGLPDVNSVNVQKSEVKRAIFEHHYRDMVEIVDKQTKLESIKGEDFREIPKYFEEKSIENSRMAFKVRSHMVPDIPGNFKNRYRVKGSENEGLICDQCQEGEIFTQSHCLTCPAWSDLRSGLELTNISDLVTFFRKLLVERAKVSG